MSDTCTATVEFCGESADQWVERWTIAHRPTTCYECADPILVGDKHLRIGMKYGDDRWHTYRVCEACAVAAREFTESWMVGSFWEEMVEQVWEEGGHIQACLNRVVGVKVKTKLRDRWLEWKFSRV